MLRSGCNNRPHKAKGETAIGVLLTATADAWQINQLSLSWSTRSEIRHCYTITTLLANGIYLHTNNNPIITVAFWIFLKKLLYAIHQYLIVRIEPLLSYSNDLWLGLLQDISSPHVVLLSYICGWFNDFPIYFSVFMSCFLMWVRCTFLQWCKTAFLLTGATCCKNDDSNSCLCRTLLCCCFLHASLDGNITLASDNFLVH